MHVTIVAADLEENLGAGMVAAALRARQHRVSVVAYNAPGELEQVAQRVLENSSDLVALALQFQYRSPDFLELASTLRARGFRGHITAGGQHATLAAEELLTHEACLDSIVLHEGEQSSAALADCLAAEASLEPIPGLLLRSPEGGLRRTPPRQLCQDLDELPWAYRYRAPSLHLGLPFLPIWGSRGCWGSCSFCAISSYYRRAREYSPGRSLRFRSVDHLAEEMVALAKPHSGPCLICCSSSPTCSSKTSATTWRSSASSPPLHSTSAARSPTTARR